MSNLKRINTWDVGEKIIANPIQSPGSIWHNSPNSTAYLKQETLNKIELERLRDFIEFLFDHSEHCNHISQNDAWEEFEEFNK